MLHRCARFSGFQSWVKYVYTAEPFFMNTGSIRLNLEFKWFVGCPSILSKEAPPGNPGADVELAQNSDKQGSCEATYGFIN